MNTDQLDALTQHAARLDGAAAFVAGRIACHTLGAYLVNDDAALAQFLGPRSSIPRHLYPLVTKAAVVAVDTSSGLAPSIPGAASFLAQVDRVSPLGQIGGIEINGPVTAAIQVGGATAAWAGEGASKPITALSFAAAAVRPFKLIAQIVLSEELATLSAPSALPIVQRSLISALAAAEATALLDSASTAIAGVRPASLTAGLAPIVAAGDLAANVGQVLTGLSGGNPTRPALIVSFLTATRMQAALRDLANIGVKVIISSAAGNSIIGVDADGLLVTNGGVEIQRGQPDVQLDDAPDSPATAATVMISTWQRDLIALKVERFRNWTARPGAVATLTLA